MAGCMLGMYQAAHEGCFAGVDPLFGELLGREPQTVRDLLEPSAASSGLRVSTMATTWPVMDAIDRWGQPESREIDNDKEQRWHRSKKWSAATWRAVTAADDVFVANGLVFRLANVDTDHDAVRHRWEMLPASGGEPDSIGTHVAVVGTDGRLVSDHQFTDKAPSAS